MEYNVAVTKALHIVKEAVKTIWSREDIALFVFGEDLDILINDIIIKYSHFPVLLYV